MRQAHTASQQRGPTPTRLVADTKVGVWRVVEHVGLARQRTTYGVVHVTDLEPGLLDVYDAPRRNFGSCIERLRTLMHTVNQLEHEGVCKILDVGALADGRPYVVREHVSGLTLGARFGSTTPSLDQALDILLSICDVLYLAHGRNIAHGALESEHVIVVDEANQLSIKLFDWGIRNDVLQPSTPGMSVARIRPTPADDVYALAVLMHRLFASVPVRFERLWMSMLSEDRSARPNIEDVAAALSAVDRAVLAREAVSTVTLPSRSMTRPMPLVAAPKGTRPPLNSPRTTQPMPSPTTAAPTEVLAEVAQKMTVAPRRPRATSSGPSRVVSATSAFMDVVEVDAATFQQKIDRHADDFCERDTGELIDEEPVASVPPPTASVAPASLPLYRRRSSWLISLSTAAATLVAACFVQYIVRHEPSLADASPTVAAAPYAPTPATPPVVAVDMPVPASQSTVVAAAEAAAVTEPTPVATPTPEPPTPTAQPLAAEPPTSAAQPPPAEPPTPAAQVAQPRKPALTATQAVQPRKLAPRQATGTTRTASPMNKLRAPAQQAGESLALPGKPVLAVAHATTREGADERAQLMAQYQRVGRRVLQLERQFGAKAGGESAARFKWIVLDKALATATSRRVLASTLDQLDRGLKAAQSRACAGAPDAAVCR